MPEDVVDAAAHPDHELHGFFDWDDSEAAKKFRLMQARMLIRTIPVVYVQEEQKKGEKRQKRVIKVRKYHALRSDRKDGGGYREIEEITSDKNMLDELEQEAKAEMEGVLRRFEVLKDLCAAVRAVIKKPAIKKK